MRGAGGLGGRERGGGRQAPRQRQHGAVVGQVVGAAVGQLGALPAVHAVHLSPGAQYGASARQAEVMLARQQLGRPLELVEDALAARAQRQLLDLTERRASHLYGRGE